MFYFYFLMRLLHRLCYLRLVSVLGNVGSQWGASVGDGTAGTLCHPPLYSWGYFCTEHRPLRTADRPGVQERRDSPRSFPVRTSFLTVVARSRLVWLVSGFVCGTESLVDLNITVLFPSFTVTALTHFQGVPGCPLGASSH